MVLTLVLSTVAFFAASYFMKRTLDGMDIPKGMTRNLIIFSVALAVSYGVAMLVDFLFP